MKWRWQPLRVLTLYCVCFYSQDEEGREPHHSGKHLPGVQLLGDEGELDDE